VIEPGFLGSISLILSTSFDECERELATEGKPKIEWTQGITMRGKNRREEATRMEGQVRNL